MSEHEKLFQRLADASNDEQSWREAAGIDLQNHPVVTGKCPRCEYEFPPDQQLIHYDCPQCGWIDNSI